MFFKYVSIKELRKTLSMSQETLAKNLGVSWLTIHNWESGKNAISNLSSNKIKAYMTTLDTDDIGETLINGSDNNS